ncbi:putative phloem protein [Helianthus annuus]|nr:putative phloem protein [Helianthus annuus]
MSNISNLNIQIKIRTQFLSPSVNYKAHLIFRFSGPRKSEAKRMYVNLKYKMGNENLHAYFATWREDGWMMIELFQFLNHKKDTDFEVLLESFSRCYCGSDSIYVEGILFQAIDNASLIMLFGSHSILFGLYKVKHREIEKLKEVQQVLKSKSKTYQFLPRKMRFAKKIVYNSSNVAIQSRFDMAVELLRKQVFHIKCKISSKMLSANTENVCYLVFKLSDKCCGLHGPVIVRDQFHWRSKEKGVLYFRSPNPCNIHEIDGIPEKREDGWMEVILWKYNSSYELINEYLFVNLKLVTYEGTMSGLIVRGIDFRTI